MAITLLLIETYQLNNQRKLYARFSLPPNKNMQCRVHLHLIDIFYLILMCVLHVCKINI